LVFFDLFRWATTGSRLSAEVSDDNGSTWTEIWSRNGNWGGSNSGWDSAFNARSVSLAAFAGKIIRIRFMYRLSGSTFINSDTNYGVFLDDISISSSTELVNTNITPLAGSATSFTLNATTVGAALVAGENYYLRVRPNVGTRWFEDSALFAVTALNASPYTSWQSARFTSGEISSGLASANEDPDRDRLTNLLEYALGTAPKTTNTAPISSNVTGGKLLVSFPCDTTRTDIIYSVQSSTDLISWIDIARSTGGATTIPIGSLSTVTDSGTGQRTVTVSDAAVTSGGKRFLRVRVTKQ
jgi:hypothetical protein